MPAITTIFPVETPTKTDEEIAIDAQRAFETLIEETKNPYINVELMTYGTALSDKETLQGETGPVIHPLDSDEGQDLIEESLTETHKLVQEKLEFAHDKLELLRQRPESTTELLKDPDTINVLMSMPDLLNAFHEISDRWGSVYRAYDLTDYSYGYPIRSTRGMTEREQFYTNQNYTPYVIEFYLRE